MIRKCALALAILLVTGTALSADSVAKSVDVSQHEIAAGNTQPHPTKLAGSQPGSARLDLTDGVSAEFETARAELVKAPVVAAEAIERAAAFIEKVAQPAAAEAQGTLLQSASELHQLAADIRHHSLSSTDHLDQVFAKAHLALAKHSFFEAARYRAQDKADLAAQEMKAASDHIWKAKALAGGTSTPLRQAD